MLLENHTDSAHYVCIEGMIRSSVLEAILTMTPVANMSSVHKKGTKVAAFTQKPLFNSIPLCSVCFSL